MKEFWDNRYRENEFAYGVEPNQFFKNVLDQYEFSGKILLPAEGEGRNAVYAAEMGLEVYAFDISVEGKKKALDLAHQKNVNINYEVGEFFDLDIIHQTYDVAALIYAHFPLDILKAYYQKIAELIKPGGMIILEGFSKNHLEMQRKNPNAGGPKNIDMLFSEETILENFPDFEILELNEISIELREGKFHNGMAKVIRFIGQKNDSGHIS
ncbi:MAG: class I SAM-dependent methyltransferase [Melioribacteraceae bacterium]|nr:class I SAM-dependent methyltransferase [Melioribacteraceae bacterium]